MDNKIQVRLQDGTIGIPDKFIVGSHEFDTQLQAEMAIKEDILLNIRNWLSDWTSVNEHSFTEELARLNKSTIYKFVELLKQLGQTINS